MSRVDGTLLHAGADASVCGGVRILLFGMWWWHIFTDELLQLALIPAEIWQPIGVLQWIPDAVQPALLSVPFLRFLRLSLLLVLVPLIAGRGPYRALALVVCLEITLYEGIVRGFGHVSHGTIPLLLITYLFALFPCADAVTLGPRRSPPPSRADALYRAPMVLGALLLATTYAAIGIERLVYGAPAVFLDGSLATWIATRGSEAAAGSNHVGVQVVRSPLMPVLTLGFPVVTLFEALAPLAVISRLFRRLWVPVIVSMHVATGVLMGIWFTSSFVLIPLLLTDLPSAAARRLRVWRSRIPSS